MKKGLYMLISLFIAGCGEVAKVKEEGATPVATVEGKVVDEFLNPIPGARARILIAGKWIENIIADENGEIRISDVPSSDSNYRMVVESPGFVPVEFPFTVSLPSNVYPTKNQIVDLGYIVLLRPEGRLDGCFTYSLPNSSPQPATNARVYISVTYPNFGYEPFTTSATTDSNGCFEVNNLPSSVFDNAGANVHVVLTVNYQGETLFYNYLKTNIPVYSGITIHLGNQNELNPECIYQGNPGVQSVSTPQYDRCDGGNDCNTQNSADNSQATNGTKVIRYTVTFDQIMDTNNAGPDIVCVDSGQNCATVDWGNSGWIRYDNEKQGVFEIWVKPGKNATGVDYEIRWGGQATNYCGDRLETYRGEL